MTSENKAVIALINRSTVLLARLNEQRRDNRELRRRLDEAYARIGELEGSRPPEGFSPSEGSPPPAGGPPAGKRVAA